MSSRRSQKGLALISALLVVSLAGVLGAGRMFTLQVESQSSKALIGNARGRMLALGIEELAAEMLAADAAASASDHPGEDWAQKIGQSIPGSGQTTFQGRMEDMQGRFNVNNMITFQGAADMIAVDQFQRLLRILELDETLAYKALDWMDSDNLPQPLAGAEDEAYTRLDPPYQAPNRPLEDVSELLAVEGLADMDAFVAVTGNDEVNIISTLVAKHLEVPRAIALVNNVNYMPITPAIGLDSVLSKQLLTVNAVQRYVRHQRIASIASLPGLDVEAVEHHPSLRNPRPKRLPPARRQVHRHQLHSRAAVPTQTVEELLQRPRTPPLTRPHHTLTVVVNHHRQIPVPLPIAELVDATPTQTLEPVRVQLARHHSLDEAPNRLPRDPHSIRLTVVRSVT